ncbi:MAG TPA: choice-of-anchor B family protein [Phycisphaerae bacterium]|nr:choice-of-anchor B family protein [Phycisphaerae bacterium]
MPTKSIHRWTAPVAALVLLTLLPASAARAQFPAQNVTLIKQLSLPDLTASWGTDCWGYVSPSGREYALMGLNNKLTVVEVTNPASPVIVGSTSHTSCTWGDVKTYSHYAYFVNDCNGGMEVIDLANIDATSNRFTLVRNVTAGGLSHSHNVAINTDSGYLYLLGSNLNGGAPVVYSLADPSNPVEVGRWTEPLADYHHDAQIVTYTAGPYAGKEILFGFSEDRGVDILDVTDKNNIHLLSRTSYPGVKYCHQGWTTADRRYLYVDDELDEDYGTTPTTRTLIFDIANLANPQLVSTFTTGLPSIDHNLYIDGCTMFEANYSSGLRVINISDPLNPVEVGYFDTYPENDGTSFDGIWSSYPYFPSGTMIVSDYERGLFILDVSAARAASDAIPGAIAFGYPNTLPATLDPRGGDSVTFTVDARCGSTLVAGSAQLHYDLGNGFVSVPAQELSPGVFSATFPPTVCTQTVPYYFSAQATGGSVYTSPSGAPSQTYLATSAGPGVTVWSDDFETNLAWTNGPDTASTGAWVRGDPVGTGGQPEDDHTPAGVSCRYTGANPTGTEGTDDVDGGTAVTTSPTIDLSGGDAIVSYYRWYYERDIGDDPTDGFLAQISNNNGASWVTIESLSPGSGGWELVEFRVSDFVAPTSAMKLRFSASDGTIDGDIVEAAIDDIRIYRPTCPPQTADVNRDGATDLRDFALFQGCYTGDGSCPCVPTLYGPTDQSACTTSDIDLDGDVDAGDLQLLVNDLTGP